jgi:hypothetical protein
MSLRNHLTALTSLFLITILTFGFVIYTGFYLEAVFISGSMWLLVGIPTIYLHLEYYLTGRGTSVILHGNQIEIEKDGRQIMLLRENVKEVILFKSMGTLTPMESYHFAIIKTVPGQTVMINCLMISDVEEALKDFAPVTIRHKKIFSSIRFCRY